VPEATSTASLLAFLFRTPWQHYHCKLAHHFRAFARTKNKKDLVGGINIPGNSITPRTARNSPSSNAAVRRTTLGCPGFCTFSKKAISCSGFWLSMVDHGQTKGFDRLVSSRSDTIAASNYLGVTAPAVRALKTESKYPPPLDEHKRHRMVSSRRWSECGRGGAEYTKEEHAIYRPDDNLRVGDGFARK